jgi:hypothetical protein
LFDEVRIVPMLGVVEVVGVGGGGMRGVGVTTGDIVVVERGRGLIETGVGEGGTIPTFKQ